MIADTIFNVLVRPAKCQITLLLPDIHHLHHFGSLVFSDDAEAFDCILVHTLLVE